MSWGMSASSGFGSSGPPWRSRTPPEQPPDDRDLALRRLALGDADLRGDRGGDLGRLLAVDLGLLRRADVDLRRVLEAAGAQRLREVGDALGQGEGGALRSAE